MTRSTPDVRYDIDFGSIPVTPAGVRPDPQAPMFAAVEGRVASLSNNECVFQSKDSDELHVMTHQVLQALDQCREFRSLDDHVARVVGVIPGLSGQGEAVRRVIAGLVDRGLLRSDSDFLAELRGGRQLKPTPLKALAVRACDRPEQAGALLTSIAEHGEQFDRKDALILIDDSTDRDAARDHVRLVQEYGRRSGAPHRYVSADQVKILVDRLAKAVPDAKQVLAGLTLKGSDLGTFGGGRGYNIALLLTAGSSLALLDDDYRLPFHHVHGASSGIDPAQSARFGVRFARDRDRALADGEPMAVDGLALQQSLVGHHLGQIVGQLPGFAIERDQLRGHALARLNHLRSDARILATFTGSRGASFTGDSTWLYDIDAVSRSGFWSDRDAYLHNVHADSLTYAPSRALVRPFGMFTPFLLDNSTLLPCTAPTGRGEDGLFGVVGSYLYPESRTLHLPITIGHVQEGRRPRYDRAMRPLTPGINRFLREWVSNNAKPSQSADSADRLVLLAAQLEDLAGASSKVRADILTEYLRYVRADLIERIQQQIGSAPDAPVYWAADARRVVEENGKALLTRTPPRLDEWPTDIDDAACAERLRRACVELAAADMGDRLLPA
jgi:hypothetical protein